MNYSTLPSLSQSHQLLGLRVLKMYDHIKRSNHGESNLGLKEKLVGKKRKSLTIKKMP